MQDIRRTSFRYTKCVVVKAAASTSGQLDLEPKSQLAHMQGLLGEMGRLSAGDVSAPTRLEWYANDMWHGMQKVKAYATGKETGQMRLESIWNDMDLDTCKAELKKLASKALNDFLSECFKVNNTNAKSITGPHAKIWAITNGATEKETATKQSDLDKFIDAMTAEEVQKLFGLILVQWEWRVRMETLWKNTSRGA